MDLHFVLQQPVLRTEPPVIGINSDGGPELMVPMLLQDNGRWEVLIKETQLSDRKYIRYALYESAHQNSPEKALASGNIKIKKATAAIKIFVEYSEKDPSIDYWNEPYFQNLKIKKHRSAYKKKKPATHRFFIEIGPPEKDCYPCITGNHKSLNNWDQTKPVLFTGGKKGKYKLDLSFSNNDYPVEYKLALWNAKDKKIIAWEEGNNRVLLSPGAENTQILHLPFLFPHLLRKATGINVQLTSLRRENGWGSGDFSDLMTMIRTAKKCGFDLIQLLPVNDTTAHFSSSDSYPYSPISSRALNPIFLDVSRLALQSGFEIPDQYEQERKRLEGLSFLDHAAALRLKLDIARKIFEEVKNDFADDTSWFIFFDLHREWLVPYAVFCYLRDINKTADFSVWKENSRFDQKNISAIVSPDADSYNDILFWYFIQYKLHEQLQSVSDLAAKKKIMLKADLPIGIGRYSVETWMYPEYFHMDMQAGAPPDFFSKTGQNWNFPTYNWNQIFADNGKLIRDRIAHLALFFDAVRIDHVLGLFRIWSIPHTDVTGTRGRFSPAIAMKAEDFTSKNISEPDRFTKPRITKELLIDLFGPDALRVQEIFFDDTAFKKTFSDERSIDRYFSENPHPVNVIWRKKLFALMADVILLRDPESRDAFHFRINMQETDMYKTLPAEEKGHLDKLYHHYFNELQNDTWQENGTKKLEAFKSFSDMLLCAEDLGMVPEFVKPILSSLRILSLSVFQMSSARNRFFSNPADAPYDCVVMPGTHDMPTIREWWETDRDRAGFFWEQELKEKGEVAEFCEPWISKRIIEMHLKSPAMLRVFLLQDVLGISGQLRRANPFEERINDPSDDHHEWRYRMHIPISAIENNKEFRKEIKSMIRENMR